MLETLKSLLTLENSLVGSLGLVICSLLWYIRQLKDSVTESSGSFTVKGKVVHVTVVWAGLISVLCSVLYVVGYFDDLLVFLKIL